MGAGVSMSGAGVLSFVFAFSGRAPFRALENNFHIVADELGWVVGLDLV